MKKKFTALSFLIFFSSLAAEPIPVQKSHKSLKTNYKEIISHARKLHREGAFEEAVEEYRRALSLKSSPSPILLFQLASAELELGRYDQVIELLKNPSHLSQNPELQYFLAISLAHKGENSRARDLLESYLKGDKILFPDHGRLTLAKIDFEMGDIEESKQLLALLNQTKTVKEVREEALLGLAKVHFKEGKIETGLHLLEQSPIFSGLIGKRYELIGSGYLTQGDYPSAVRSLEKGMAEIGTEPGEIKDSLRNLIAEASLLAACDPTLPLSDRFEYLEKGKQFGADESHLLFARYSLSGDPLALLSASSSLSSSPYSMYMGARLARTPDEIKTVATLLESMPEDSYYTPLSWYYLGVASKKQNPKQALLFFTKGAPFERSLEQMVETHLLLGDVETALNLINRNGTNSPKLLHLKAICLYKTGQPQDAKLIWKNLILEKKEPLIQSEAHFALATFDYKEKDWQRAKERFLHLQLESPSSPKAAEALFFAAKCMEELGETSGGCKRKLIDHYQDSPFAAEAHFSLFPLSAYLAGEEDAMAHLQELTSRFPKSKTAITALFLLGLNARQDRKTSSGKLTHPRDLFAAIKSFNASVKTSDEIDPLGELAKIKYQALIEKAETELEVAELSEGMKSRLYEQYANDTLKKLVAELKSHKKNNAYDEFLIEAEFRLANTYRLIEENGAAETILRSLLEKFEEAKTTRGYYLSRVYYELAKLTRLRTGNAVESLALLEKAEESAQGNLLTPDQKLDLWTQQSDCYLHLGDDDKAMKILSKVINEDVASSERLKAMYLRSEIYALQGREELAIKQLEALSKQQGIWAKKAKEKLRTYE